MTDTEIIITYPNDGVQTKVVTGRQAFNALKKNGLNHIRGTYYDYSGQEVVGGCFIGQGSVNLGTSASDLEVVLDSAFPNLSGLLIDLNDTARAPYEEILLALKNHVQKSWYTKKFRIRKRSYKVVRKENK